MQTTWTLVSPQAAVGTQADRVNAHPATLSGKTVVLYWNGKPNGEGFLNRIGALLAEKVPDCRIVKSWEVHPLSTQTDPDPQASRAVAAALAGLSPDLVIGAPGDCAGATQWLVTDQLNLERLGVPTVTVVTDPFAALARTIPLAEGFKETCLVQVAPPFGMLSPEAIAAKAEEAFGSLLKAATDWQPSEEAAAQAEPLPAARIECSGNVAELNRVFREEGWSLGLPILPPTPDRVQALLRGISRRPDEILGPVPPAMGTLTIELVAVYAAMAGCRPEVMPVLIAALEGFLAPEANWRMALSGTGTSQLVVIVNGPICAEIGIASGQGAAGKGQQANGSIGYALNLIAYAVRGSRPPALDRSTLGSPADYVAWVFGENEAALPEGWEPLHCERGFRRSESVVTVMAAYPPVENMDHWSSSPGEHLRWWGRIVTPLHNMGGPSLPQMLELQPLVALGPEHARLIAAAGWNKQAFRRALWEATRIPMAVWPASCGREKLSELLGPVDDESLIPVTIGPEQFLIVIAGGDGKQSHYFAPLPGSYPASRVIRG